MTEKQEVMKLLHICIGYELKQIKDITESIGEMRHQIEYFNDMAICFQITVITDLLTRFRSLQVKYPQYKWEDSINKLIMLEKEWEVREE